MRKVDDAEWVKFMLLNELSWWCMSYVDDDEWFNNITF